MDPDAAVQRLRELSAQVDMFTIPEPDEADAGKLQRALVEISMLAEEMAVTFDGLDGWMTSNGFPPARWAQPPVPAWVKNRRGQG